MRGFKTLAMAALLASALPVQAAPNAASRVQAFAKLPDWSGLWLSDSIVEDSSALIDAKRLKFMQPRPLTPKAAEEAKKRAAAGAGKETKGCLIDFPVSMESPQPFKLIVTPEETIFLSGDGMWRQIFTDGRPHPPKDKLWPTVTGHSIGHWEGETLVVDTIERLPGPVHFIGAVAFSEQARFHERIRMTGKDSMEDQMAIEDPGTLTKPWTLNLTYKRVTFIDRLDPYYCELDQRIDFNQNGKMVIKPAAAAAR